MQCCRRRDFPFSLQAMLQGQQKVVQSYQNAGLEFRLLNLTKKACLALQAFPIRRPEWTQPAMALRDDLKKMKKENEHAVSFDHRFPLVPWRSLIVQPARKCSN